MFERLNEMSLMAYVWLQNSVYLAKNKLSSERGDTNFISIMIILGVVVVVAAVFIGFKEQIVTKAQELMEQFTGLFNQQQMPTPP